MASDRPRCVRCGRVGHTTDDHNAAIIAGKRPNTTFVIAYDVSGCITQWHGPLTWANAAGVARCIEATNEYVGRVLVTEHRPVVLRGEPDPLPPGWSDYHPLVSRAPRLVANHARTRGAA